MVHRTRYKIITSCLSRLYTRIYPRSSPISRSKIPPTNNSAHSQNEGLGLGWAVVGVGCAGRNWWQYCTHVGCLAGGLLFSFHTHYGRYLAVLPPVWRGHSLRGARQDFILIHILYTRRDAVGTLYPNPNISAQQSSLSFSMPYT